MDRCHLWLGSLSHSEAPEFSNDFGSQVMSMLLYKQSCRTDKMVLQQSAGARSLIVPSTCVVERRANNAGMRSTRPHTNTHTHACTRKLTPTSELTRGSANRANQQLARSPLPPPPPPPPPPRQTCLTGKNAVPVRLNPGGQDDVNNGLACVA